MVQKAEYRRKINGSNLILTANRNCTVEKDSVGMFLCNEIPYFLKMRIQRKDETLMFCYDMTRKRSLEQILEYKPLDYILLQQILNSFDQACMQVENYMLTEQDILLKPEFIFCESESTQMTYCYFPGNQEDICSQFKEFMEYLLQHLDHKDEQAVNLAYGVYQKVAEEGAALHTVLADIKKGEGSLNIMCAQTEEKPKNPTRQVQEQSQTQAKKSEMQNQAQRSNIQMQNQTQARNERIRNQTQPRRAKIRNQARIQNKQTEDPAIVQKQTQNKQTEDPAIVQKQTQTETDFNIQTNAYARQNLQPEMCANQDAQTNICDSQGVHSEKYMGQDIEPDAYAAQKYVSQDIKSAAYAGQKYVSQGIESDAYVGQKYVSQDIVPPTYAGQNIRSSVYANNNMEANSYAGSNIQPGTTYASQAMQGNLCGQPVMQDNAYASQGNPCGQTTMQDYAYTSQCMQSKMAGGSDIPSDLHTEQNVHPNLFKNQGIQSAWHQDQSMPMFEAQTEEKLASNAMQTNQDMFWASMQTRENIANSQMQGGKKAANSPIQGGERTADSPIQGEKKTATGQMLEEETMPGQKRMKWLHRIESQKEKKTVRQEEPSENIKVKRKIINKFKRFLRKKIYTNAGRNVNEDCIFEADTEEEIVMGRPTVCLMPESESIQNQFVYQGADRGRDFQCMEGKIILGSSTKETDICIPLPMVSRIHAKVEVSPLGTFLEDMNSTNGTLVNGELLKYRERRMLQKGDIISFAGECYSFH